MTDQDAQKRDLSSLPSWAQDYIKRLRKEAQDARNKLKAATGKH